MTRTTVLAVLLAGCAGSKAATAPTPLPLAAPTCDDVGNHLLETLATGGGVEAGQAADLRKLVTRRCKDDAWADDARRCVVDASTHEEAHACLDKLTPAQRAAVERDGKGLHRVQPGVEGGVPPAESSDPCEGGE